MLAPSNGLLSTIASVTAIADCRDRETGCGSSGADALASRSHILGHQSDRGLPKEAADSPTLHPAAIGLIA